MGAVSPDRLQAGYGSLRMHSVTPNDPKVGYKEGQGHPKSHWMGYRDTGKDAGRDAVTPNPPSWAIGTQKGCCDPTLPLPNNSEPPQSHNPPRRVTGGPRSGAATPMSPNFPLNPLLPPAPPSGPAWFCSPSARCRCAPCSCRPRTAPRSAAPGAGPAAAGTTAGCRPPAPRPAPVPAAAGSGAARTACGTAGSAGCGRPRTCRRRAVRPRAAAGTPARSAAARPLARPPPRASPRVHRQHLLPHGGHGGGGRPRGLPVPLHRCAEPLLAAAAAAAGASTPKWRRASPRRRNGGRGFASQPIGEGGSKGGGTKLRALR